MPILLLLIIYIAFISLGLPDSLLGSAWTVMHKDLNVPLGMAGLLSMTVSGGTIFSALFSHRIINRFGTGKVTFVSVMATALALLGFSQAPSVFWMFLLAIPLGLGAGSVDAGLNNYVALHYKPHHMSWLHSFWGIGATLGPVIMAQSLLIFGSWRNGYLSIGLIQTALVVLLFATLPLWNKVPGRQDLDHEEQSAEQETGESVHYKKNSLFHIPGVVYSLLAFFCYCGLEASVGLWGSSFLVQERGLTAVTAARWISLYFAGITIGRFITGFVTMKMSNRKLILVGQIVALLGVLMILIPLPSGLTITGLILIGLGCAPIFPCMLHETPKRFGKSLSQQIMGLQMAGAYVGMLVLPPLFGLVQSAVGMAILPVFLILYTIGMFLASETINKKIFGKIL